MPPVPDITMHAVMPSTVLDVIGHIDRKQIYPRRITFTVGDGDGGKFPYAGLVDERLGECAVSAWLEAENPERAERAMRRDLRSIEKDHEALLAIDRAARARRKALVKS